MSKIWKVAGINFDHMHMGDLLRMVQEHPSAEIVGICDEQESRMQASANNFGIPTEHIFTDYRACLEKTQPDFVILCPATAEHGDWTEKVAPIRRGRAGRETFCRLSRGSRSHDRGIRSNGQETRH